MRQRARIDVCDASARASASSASRSGPSPISHAAADRARGVARRLVVDAQHGKLQVGQRMARAHDVERAFDLLLAGVDQVEEPLPAAARGAARFR